MKLPDYDSKYAKWDRFRRFHNTHKEWFVGFESGEAIITKDGFAPTERRTLTGTDLQIVATSDDDCPRLRLDPKAPDYEATKRAFLEAGHDLLKVFDAPVPKAWLHIGGAQTLLVDKTTGRAVSLCCLPKWRHEAWKHLPRWVNTAPPYRCEIAAYLPGNDRDAIASKVRLEVPVIHSTEARREMAALHAGCDAWCALADNDTTTLAPKWYAVDPKHYGSRRYIHQCPFTLLGRDDIPTIEDLSPEQRFQISRYGFDKIYKHVVVDHMLACQ